MDIVKNEYISDLLGIYGKLLTDYQLEIMELYYFEDLSLSVNTSSSLNQNCFLYILFPHSNIPPLFHKKKD